MWFLLSKLRQFIQVVWLYSRLVFGKNADNAAHFTFDGSRTHLQPGNNHNLLRDSTNPQSTIRNPKFPRGFGVGGLAVATSR